MIIRLRHFAPFLAAAATATAIAVAPPAQAASNVTDCRTHGQASVCQRQGHASIQVDPPARANQGFGFGRFGFGPMSPMWLLG